MMEADGFKAAIVGVVYDQWGTGESRLVYSIPLIIETLITRDGMTVDEAREFYSFNVVGSYVGKGTPLFIEEWIDPYETESDEEESKQCSCSEP